ncbi:hypothetical protein MCOR27_002346 [Pyricularia oryzae]|uniref:Uncharacterized protein n=1 Tax=Pyricularia oryzae TaxID=318829 RepID=A0A4P7NW84_PYROR|nr:hypothetical protein MCOR19_003178 [Pyricularia oryzae]KAI6285427.1 hypothetical protein MCOR27_002346 [Pyricularia oryzae]KAI6325220.1 hypothetical protein MCOR29_003834 [Pyricularia oryzae]KAI6339969.1 hypothetical protein MCOR28_006903 [Pyricularia oryzae]KAI6379257.1 hypothetical protein MCOR31_000183 [Pyricularia oryzae]
MILGLPTPIRGSSKTEPHTIEGKLNNRSHETTTGHYYTKLPVGTRITCKLHWRVSGPKGPQHRSSAYCIYTA